MSVLTVDFDDGSSDFLIIADNAICFIVRGFKRLVQFFVGRNGGCIPEGLARAIPKASWIFSLNSFLSVSSSFLKTISVSVMVRSL